jgi:hypothetical protein
VTELPWWAQAKDDDEVANSDRHPAAKTFDGRRLAEERSELDPSDFALRMESLSGLPLAELSSRSRSADLTRGRMEFATLAAGRYRLKVSDIATLLDKHPNSVTKWLNKVLRLEREDPGFKERPDHLDAEISRQS